MKVGKTNTFDSHPTNSKDYDKEPRFDPYCRPKEREFLPTLTKKPMKQLIPSKKEKREGKRWMIREMAKTKRRTPTITQYYLYSFPWQLDTYDKTRRKKSNSNTKYKSQSKIKESKMKKVQRNSKSNTM